MSEEDGWGKKVAQMLADMTKNRKASPDDAVFVVSSDIDDFDEDAACIILRNMWLTLAANLQITATQITSNSAATTKQLMDAVRIGLIADACYWHATGTGDNDTLLGLLDAKATES